ncbi:MAG: hypothetical protein PHD48_00965 [Alphaproteobacteria bacterium]|nr:hypothetical protein [Alphaproteobacteria bacterium]
MPPFILMIPPAHVLVDFAYPKLGRDPVTGKFRRRRQNAPKPPVADVAVVPEFGVGAVFLQEREEGKLVRVVMANIDDHCGQGSMQLAARQLALLLGKKERGYTAHFVAAPCYGSSALVFASALCAAGIVFNKSVVNLVHHELRVSLVTGQVIPLQDYKSRVKLGLANDDEVRAHIAAAEDRKSLRPEVIDAMSLGVECGGEKIYTPTAKDYGVAPLRRTTLADVALPQKSPRLMTEYILI